MAEGIVYLDVDDEITSAASRIRMSAGSRVALVVPYGSRIATSRMNFRLLSREAVISNKRLSIVSGDAASRSLAASAGLPVFGSVSEYEGSLTSGSSDADSGAPPTRQAPRPPAPPSEPRRTSDPASEPSPEPQADEPDEPGPPSGLAASATVIAAAPSLGLEDSPTVVTPVPGRKSQRPKRPAPAPDAASSIPASAMAPAGAAAGTAAPDATATSISPTPAREAPWRRPEPAPRPAPRDRDRDDDEAARPALLGGRIRTPMLVALAAVGLAAVVLAVGAYLLLPSAEIELTPRQEPIAPIQISVAADPTATSVDAAKGVVPAVTLEVPVEAAQTFPTTGTHVETAPATGSVTFSNYDPTAQNTIVSGSVVSTEGGVRFRTVATVIVPRANFIFPPGRVEPATRSVRVEAVKAGPEGNVAANTIRSVPQGENPEFLKVNNPAPTEGGTRTETPEVTKAEVDKAVATLEAVIQSAFEQAIADGAGAPEDTTLFPQTATLGDPVPDGNPQSFVGQAVPSFDLRLTAKGTVIAVDPRPVRTIAEARLAEQIDASHQLIPDSVDITVGPGDVGEDGQVTFEATARGTRVAIVDPSRLRELVKGRTAADARAALAPFGEARVSLWPDWVTTVTGMDSRLTITVADVAGTGSAPGASPTTRPAGSAAGRSGPPRSSPGTESSPDASTAP
jgi:Baseplate J-like protein